MSGETGTVAFCPSCGEVHPEVSQLLDRHLQDMRTISALKAELSRQRKNSPQAQQARQVFEYWVERLGKNGNVVFGPAREKAVQARLREYPLEVVLRAVDGCALMPYVGPHGRQADGRGAKKHDDLALICRDETTVERFASYVDEPPEAPTPIRRHVPVYEPPPIDKVLQAIDKLDLKRTSAWNQHGSWSSQCPAHEDRSPSLSIREVEADGRVLLHCFAGCHVTEICDALGLSLSDLFPRERAA